MRSGEENLTAENNENLHTSTNTAIMNVIGYQHYSKSKEISPGEANYEN